MDQPSIYPFLAPCRFFLPLFLFFMAAGCTRPEKQWTAELKERTKADYPDDPDRTIAHSLYEQTAYKDITFTRKNDDLFDIAILPDQNGAAISIASVSLMEYIPTISKMIEKDEYLSYIGVINQEWNRNQVAFNEGQFSVTGENLHHIKRVDIARNCLNAYLWEVIVFAEEDGKLKPYYHGWFDFPHVLYAALFEKKNRVPFAKYQKPLENWIDPENKLFRPELLRKVVAEKEVPFENRNAENYPLKGEREKKFKNIINPVNTTVIQRFLTDSSLFATFSPPGCYNRSDPRKTELSRLAKADKVTCRRTIAAVAPGDTLLELEILFNRDDSAKTTHLIISGIRMKNLPVLDTANANEGWQNSMGIGNHTFHESYEHAQQNPALTNPYFSVLTNGENLWLDSHKIGIDGPLLFWDKQDTGLLHVWILSFERHAFVGHYVVRVL